MLKCNKKHFRTWPVFYYETKITLFTQPNTVNISKILLPVYPSEIKKSLFQTTSDWSRVNIVSHKLDFLKIAAEQLQWQRAATAHKLLKVLLYVIHHPVTILLFPRNSKLKSHRWMFLHPWDSSVTSQDLILWLVPTRRGNIQGLNFKVDGRAEVKDIEPIRAAICYKWFESMNDIGRSFASMALKLNGLTQVTVEFWPHHYEIQMWSFTKSGRTKLCWCAQNNFQF